MGVYIKSMKMPRSCLECPFCSHGSFDEWKMYCTELHEYLGNFADAQWDRGWRHDQCPIVEVHGGVIQQAKLNPPVDMFPDLTEEEKQQNRWYAQGMADALKSLKLDEDTISRQAVRLIESDSDAYPEEWNSDYEWGFASAIKKVLALPSVESVIIRCKDCLMHSGCRFEQSLGLDGYCSHGERREDG